MANNQNIAISDLERGKFRPDATQVDSTIQSYNTAPLQYRDPDTGDIEEVNGSGGSINVTGDITLGGKTAPNSRTISLPLAATEYSIAFPTNCVQFSVSNQGVGGAIFQVSWSSGGTATNFFSLRPGMFYEETGIIATNLTLYIRSDKPGAEVHVIEWT